MALSGLDIYKQLPRSNCKECGFPTCLAFAMQLAAKRISLDKCPHISNEGRLALESASQPPIRLVSFGMGEQKIELGNETVMFRHEEKFYHPTAIGFLVEDDLKKEEFEKRVLDLNKLQFERVGRKFNIDLIFLICKTNNLDNFTERLKFVLQNSNLNLILSINEPNILRQALALSKEKGPLIYAATSNNFKDMSAIAKEFNLPLVVKGDGLDELANLVKEVTGLGVGDLILDLCIKNISDKTAELTHIRRLALKKNFRPFGYPVIAFTKNSKPYMEACEAATYILKYASIVILKNIETYLTLPILTVRSDIYTDPQKPVQVEPKVYQIGHVKEQSPVLVTTNFSITFYTVQGEVEASKVGSYLISVDTEGMSVLTAWAAEKFTPERIAAVLNSNELKISHKKIIIPGYVAVMSGKLEEASGWQVIVGPREAAGIPSFLRSLKI